MSEAESDLKFDVLLDRVLSHWPDSIDVTQIIVAGDRQDLYVVSGLGRLGDSIVEALEGSADAVLLISLCDSLTSTIRSAALYFMEVKPASLRASTVRRNFEDRLHRAATNPDLGWTEEDVLLINRYFAVSLK
ncbi:hypothetical protein KDX30_01230 [Pseudomonas sp. CDFA 553]|uniref:hypothetical protein n=1 Tax=Pseudomonas quasicaspiana TaxID=2829821 RepID=UPI001E381426|nr:hypothetical protein [Pseudomonas quasicaspiana]MCD5986512.1 hypothetical protein [Pseudomonas quasicaspiana]